MTPEPELVGRPEVPVDQMVGALDHFLARTDGGLHCVSLEPGPFSFYNTHPMEAVTAQLSDGSHLALVLKHVQVRSSDGRACEALTYRRLLSGRRFDAPQLYGSACGPGHRRCWALLEDVGRARLEWCGWEAWLAAARWLARAHRPYWGREQALLGLAFVPSHDARLYNVRAVRAHAALGGAGPERRGRFDRLMRHYDHSVAFLAQLPRTLVHGAPRGTNLLLLDGVVRPVDWEGIAIAHPAVDLDTFLEGWGARRERLLEAYQQELEDLGITPSPGELRLALRHCSVQRALRRLGRLAPGSPPGEADLLLDHIEGAWTDLKPRLASG